MRTKAIAVLLIAGLVVLMGMALRSANRASAAATNCYSDGAGPSTPTICS
jgi:hypothetical protein